MPTPLSKKNLQKKCRGRVLASYSGCMYPVKTNEEVEGSKTKRSTYIKRTVDCPYSKVLVIIKVIKMILVMTIITTATAITIKCREVDLGPSQQPTPTSL